MKGFIKQVYRNNKDYKGLIFLDRDGTLIDDDPNYIKTRDQIRLLPTVVEAIKLLNERKIAVVITTNQPVIARGFVTIEELKNLHDIMYELLKSHGVYIEAIYSCPHHPERDHADITEELLKFRIVCECRKPGLAMFKTAVDKYGQVNILGVVGDQTKDVLAGQNLGTKGVLVKTGYGGEDGRHDVIPDFVEDSLLACINRLL